MGTERRLAWGNRVSNEFRTRVNLMGATLAVDPSWLMAIMAFETGRTFSASVKNSQSGATGLIQFMPTTAVRLGTTVDKLAQMTPEEQLEWVEKYFAPYRGAMYTLADCYMAVLWPAAVGKPPEYVIFSAGSKAYAQNRGLDIDHDNNVTKAECAAFVAKLLEEGLRPENSVPLAAPIEDRSIPAQQPVETSVAPAAFLIPLLTSLAEVFSPLLRSKLSQTLDKQVKDPVMSQQMADQLMAIVKQAASTAMPTQPTGPLQPGYPPVVTPQMPPDPETIDPVIAVGTVKANPALVAVVEEDFTDFFDRMAPVYDRLEKLDQAAWSASEDSMDRAAQRARTDAFDPGPTLLYAAVAGVGVVTLFVGAAIGVQLLRGDVVGTEMWAALTGLIGWITAKAGTIYDYRYGSSRSSAAKDVMIEEIAMRRKA